MDEKKVTFELGREDVKWLIHRLAIVKADAIIQRDRTPQDETLNRAHYQLDAEIAHNIRRDIMERLHELAVR